MFKAFVYRLYPSKSQRAPPGSRARDVPPLLQRSPARAEGCLRTARRVDHQDRRSFARSRSRRPRSPYALDIHSHILQNVVADLDKAFQAFFRRVKAGENPGYPRFRGRNRFAGFGFKEYGNGFKIDGRRLKLSGIGRIAVRWHREIEGKIKTARIFCRAGKWFVAFACEVEKPEPLPTTGESIGIDVGLHRLATLSNGEEVDNPRWYRRILRKLRVIQRSISRKKLGGSNRRKAVRLLQRLMVRVANTRKDFLNKFVDELIKRFDRIVLEDLRVAAMARGRLAMSILDAGWSYLISRLTHKAESAGREVVEVDPAYTSKTCSGCGVLFEHLSLSDRWVSCDCGSVPGSGPQRRDQHPQPWARTEPLGVKLGNGRVSPRSRRTLVRAECHVFLCHDGIDRALSSLWLTSPTDPQSLFALARRPALFRQGRPSANYQISP